MKTLLLHFYLIFCLIPGDVWSQPKTHFCKTISNIPWCESIKGFTTSRRILKSIRKSIALGETRLYERSCSFSFGLLSRLQLISVCASFISANLFFFYMPCSSNTPERFSLKKKVHILKG